MGKEKVKFEKIDVNVLKKELESLKKEPKDFKQSYNDGLEVQKFLITQIEERTNSLQRLQAEFENYKKRTDKEKTEFVKYASSNLISKLLPVLDNMQLAMNNKDNQEEYIKGTDMIFKQFIEILQEEGLEKISTVNEKFDPFFHEALLQEEAEEDNMVLQELQAGYKIHGKIMRHAKVKISKKVNQNGK